MLFASILAYAPVVYAADNWQFNFLGYADELTGAVINENVTVTTYYMTGYPTSFNVTPGGVTENFAVQPRYFVFNLTDAPDRHYWVEPTENDTDITIYYANATLYTLQFNDLVNSLATYPYVEIQSLSPENVNTIEKLKVDTEKKVQVAAIYGQTYTVKIGGYTFGELLFGATTPITLDLTGLIFPETVIMGYKYVQVYANRDMSTGDINAYYNDELDVTTSVDLNIYVQSNDTLAYSTTSTDNPWVFSWSGASNTTDYYLTIIIDHETFGILTYRQVLPRLLGYGAPLDLSALGASLPFDSNYLIPAFIILAVAGAFSALNVVVGLFSTVSVAAIIAYIGWLPIGADILVFAFAMCIVLAFVKLRRPSYS